VGGYPVFYAGRSANLKRRLGEHLDSSRCQPCIRSMRTNERTYFSAAVLELNLAIHAEAGLVRLLRPVCNRQIPKAAPILVTLPRLSVTPLQKGHLT